MIITIKICPKTIGIISKLSRRDTIIVNCQLSIVNSAKPSNSNLTFYCVNPISIISYISYLVSCILYLISYIFQREELILAVMSLTLSWVTLSLALTAVSTRRMA